MIKIAAVGDIMPGGLLSGTSDFFVSSDVLNVLRDADVRVGTLETAIGSAPTFYEEKMVRSCDVIYAKDEDLKRLKVLDVNIVSLANNHFFDLGIDGALHTIDLLDSMNIQHCGAGRNIVEASQPVVIEIDEKRIAFLAFCDWRAETVGWCPFATETSAGVNPMSDDWVVAQIKKYKMQYDYVVVIPHWGKEHTYVTTRYVYRLADKMVAAGADVVLGSHPHRVQPAVIKKNKVIAYSLGNFLFPDRIIVKPRSTFYPDEIIDTSLLPVTYGYPYVEDMTLKIWKYLARIGMILSITIGEVKLSYATHFSVIDAENKLKMYNIPMKIRFPLAWQKFWIVYLPYVFYEVVFTEAKRMLKKIRCLVHRINCQHFD